eukprot:CAMPEP_0194714966 /NCGR_PEP_ID=MMETSP0296-20130528/6673_1 /TAXON_ID=39354 /ORGANISM="Heterosigma akashiwo, Strain CCMP2393" /LENGTH=96 /DNA_ID=CAMNT_0039614489 /DNA_START=13 /DNA_END=304 /DNA_ORIENTATION=-
MARAGAGQGGNPPPPPPPMPGTAGPAAARRRGGGPAAALAPDRVRQIEIVRTRNHNNEEIRNAADEIFEKFVDENIFYDEVEIEEAIKLGQAQGAL